MDSLIEDALDAAALRSNCINHPDLPAVTSIYSAAHDWQRIRLCKECSDKLHPFGRAYATGLGPQAHVEA